MSNKQQTAVEQFAIALYEKGLLKGNGDDMQELLEQAKEMEKEQKEISYADGYSQGYERVARLIEETTKLNILGDNNGEITTMGGDNNNNPDTNTSTTGNILNTWRSHGVNITGNTSDNMWTKTLTNDRNLFENDLWNKTVNWDKNNIEVKTEVNDEEQALYNKTIVIKDGAMETIRVSKPDETNDGTLAVIEITVKVRSN
jgi:hypothetical protein